jgi:signal transduction histidine kinase
MTLVWVLLFAARIARERRRMKLIARAEHELRGPLAAIALGAGSDPRVREEIERARIALADLTAARHGRIAAARPELVRLDRLAWRAVAGWDLAARRAGGAGVQLDWRAGPVSVRADRGRLAQAIGNLLANAVEHGGGSVCVVGRRTRGGVRIEIRDSGRGHGFGIAARAVREAGGSLTAARAGTGTAVTVDLPVASEPPPPAAA